MKFGRLAVLAGCVALCACANNTGPTPAQVIAGLQAAATVTAGLAQAYENLPTCGPGVSKVCSDPATIAKIQAAIPAVEDTITAAEVAVTSGSSSPAAIDADITAATAALAALAALVPTASNTPEVKAALHLP